MKPSSCKISDSARRWRLPLRLVSACLLVVSATLRAGIPASVATPAPKVEAVTEEKPAGLTGVEIWTMNCSRCHTYRGPNEFPAAQWQTLMMHMRVRANLPAAQAREVLKFLQAGAGK